MQHSNLTKQQLHMLQRPVEAQIPVSLLCLSLLLMEELLKELQHGRTLLAACMPLMHLRQQLTAAGSAHTVVQLLEAVAAITAQRCSQQLRGQLMGMPPREQLWGMMLSAVVPVPPLRGSTAR
jgi:glycerol-3-phosphate O-acyltransferase